MSEPWEKKISGAVKASRIGGVFTLIGGVIVILGIVLVLRQATVAESMRESVVTILQNAVDVVAKFEEAVDTAAQKADDAVAAEVAELQEADDSETLDMVEILAEALQPSEVIVAAQLDPSLLSLDNAQISLAGPDSVYITNITYDGQTYSAVLKYRGGTTGTIEAAYGSRGKLIPDSVGLSATELSFVSPDVVGFSYVEIGGDGYSGELRYDGGNRLNVVGIRRVTLPATEADEAQAEASRMRAENESLKALIADQQKNIAALKAELAAAAAQAVAVEAAP